MTQVSVEEAQQRLPELLAVASAGETVEITAADEETFRLAPNRPRPPVTATPRAGRWRGRMVVPDDFDAPLDELHEYTP